ncbi:MAG TPA: hypothetical protein DCZ30_03470 [Clostridiales bacterium]|nr:hypothetical protein [Clostridiales bacterium]
MKKANITICIVIFLMCVILVSVILMRVKAVEETDFETESVTRETELRKEISTWKSKYEKISETLESINQKILEYEDQIEKNEDSSDLVEKELEQTNVLLGKKTVRGEGIIVTLTDKENAKILATDLSEIINEIKYAGAEAISINGIRILPMTDVTGATNDLILINGQRISSPYQIKAIGNQTYLYSTLNAKNGFIDYYTNQYDIDIKVEKQKNVTIDKTNQEVNLKYIKEGEE